MARQHERVEAGAMTATGHIRGQAVVWDGLAWRHSDDGSPAPGWGGDERPCPKCGLIAESAFDPDPCLGLIPTAISACCGHGIEAPYCKIGVQVTTRNEIISRGIHDHLNVDHDPRTEYDPTCRVCDALEMIESENRVAVAYRERAKSKAADNGCNIGNDSDGD